MAINQPQFVTSSYPCTSIGLSITLLIMSTTSLIIGCDDTETASTSAPESAQESTQGDDTSARDLPALGRDVIGIASDDFFPEGITRSDAGDIYMGSVNTGAIVVVKRGQQWAQELISGSRFEGAGTAGLIADSSRSALWACTGDFFSQIPSKIWRFDLTTGETQAHYELPGRSFCNDLALDDQGRLYATDSFGGRIIKVDDQGLTVWLEGEAYEPANNSPLSLNGITWDPQGKLWFGRSDTGQLSSVVINEDGSAGEVDLDQLDLSEDDRPQGIDGLKWRAPGELIAIRGRVVYQLKRVTSLNDDVTSRWEMTLIDDTLAHATTFTFDEPNDFIWVVESQLSRFYQSTTPDFPFQAQRIALPATTSR